MTLLIAMVTLGTAAAGDGTDLPEGTSGPSITADVLVYLDGDEAVRVVDGEEEARSTDHGKLVQASFDRAAEIAAGTDGESGLRFGSGVYDLSGTDGVDLGGDRGVTVHVDSYGSEFSGAGLRNITDDFHLAGVTVRNTPQGEPGFQFTRCEGGEYVSLYAKKCGGPGFVLGGTQHATITNCRFRTLKARWNLSHGFVIDARPDGATIRDNLFMAFTARGSAGPIAVRNRDANVNDVSGMGIHQLGPVNDNVFIMPQLEGNQEDRPHEKYHDNVSYRIAGGCRNVLLGGHPVGGLREEDPAAENHLLGGRYPHSGPTTSGMRFFKVSGSLDTRPSDLSRTPGVPGAVQRDTGANFAPGEYAYGVERDDGTFEWRAWSDPEKRVEVNPRSGVKGASQSVVEVFRSAVRVAARAGGATPAARAAVDGKAISGDELVRDLEADLSTTVPTRLGEIRREGGSGSKFGEWMRALPGGENEKGPLEWRSFSNPEERVIRPSGETVRATTLDRSEHPPEPRGTGARTVRLPKAPESLLRAVDVVVYRDGSEAVALTDEGELARSTDHGGVLAAAFDVLRTGRGNQDQRMVIRSGRYDCSDVDRFRMIGDGGHVSGFVEGYGATLNRPVTRIGRTNRFAGLTVADTPDGEPGFHWQTAGLSDAYGLGARNCGGNGFEIGAAPYNNNVYCTFSGLRAINNDGHGFLIDGRPKKTWNNANTFVGCVSVDNGGDGFRVVARSHYSAYVNLYVTGNNGERAAFDVRGANESVIVGSVIETDSEPHAVNGGRGWHIFGGRYVTSTGDGPRPSALGGRIDFAATKYAFGFKLGHIGQTLRTTGPEGPGVLVPSDGEGPFVRGEFGYSVNGIWRSVSNPSNYSNIGGGRSSPVLPVLPAERSH